MPSETLVVVPPTCTTSVSAYAVAPTVVVKATGIALGVTLIVTVALAPMEVAPAGTVATVYQVPVWSLAENATDLFPRFFVVTARAAGAVAPHETLPKLSDGGVTLTVLAV